MNYETLLSMIGHFGYAVLFFSLWLGIVGMPIPDEVIVMTGGGVTTSGLLQPLPAFIMTYLGVVTGLSLGYVLGRWIGAPVLGRLRRKKNLGRYIQISERLVHTYGSFALCLSYFFPVVRHIMPYLVGVNRMTFRRYALISYSTGFVWTLIFFTVGRYVGDHAEAVGTLLYTYGLKLLWLPSVLAAVFFILKHTRKNRSADTGSVN